MSIKDRVEAEINKVLKEREYQHKSLNREYERGLGVLSPVYNACKELEKEYGGTKSRGKNEYCLKFELKDLVCQIHYGQPNDVALSTIRFYPEKNDKILVQYNGRFADDKEEIVLQDRAVEMAIRFVAEELA